jgi:L-rhamnose mutarotase
LGPINLIPLPLSRTRILRKYSKMLEGITKRRGYYKMKRFAFIFKIKPELKKEYKKAHDEIWPEMAQAIRDSGIRNYSIFFRKDGTLFAYLEAEDPEKSFEYIGKQEVNERWQKAMDKYFIKENPQILGPELEVIEEVFHID